MKRYEGKVAVITGGNSGIGYAAAERLRAEGAHVVIVGRREDKVAEATKRLGDDVVGLTADVSDNAQLDGLVEQLKTKHDRIDLLFANAGVAFFAPVDAVDEAFFDNITNINQRGLFFTVQKLLPLLKEGSSVVINTSVVNEIGLENGAVYAATKAAARNLARGFAAELAPKGIRVNAVNPVAGETPLLKSFMGEDTPAIREKFLSTIPLGRFSTPDDIANGAL